MSDLKSQFKRIKKRQTFGFFLVLPFIVALVVLGGAANPKSGEAYGLPMLLWLPVSFIPIVIYAVYSFKCWRCPACKTYLGKNYNPTFCPKCAANLQ